MKFRKAATALAVGAVAAAAVVSCGGDSGAMAVTKGTIVQNVTVVNTRDGSLQSGMNVILQDGKIDTITSQALQAAGSSVQVVDGGGRYMVPGFMDMHTHAGSTIANTPSDFNVLLANGVTAVREAGGSPALITAVRAQNAAVAAGTVDAPEVVMMPSTIFAGQSATDAGARQFVRDRLAEGANFIKITAGGAVAFLAAVDEAKKQGSHAAGHLPVAVSAAAASDAGYHSFEHLGSGMGLMIDCSTDAASIRAAAVANPAPPATQVVNPRIFDGNVFGPLYQRIVDTFDLNTCAALAKVFVKNDSWQTVTLIRSRTQIYGADPVYTNNPDLKYVDKTRVALWTQTAAQYQSTVTPANQASLRAFYATQQKGVKLLQQNGVKILAGSDLGGGWCIPGFSLHQEFRELGAAGLTPLEVLQATTLNGAQFAGRESTMGTVEKGKNADLVLLDANPIADVANLDKVAGVFLRGKYYSRGALDKILADVAAAYVSQPLKLLSSVIDPDHIPHN